jgi:hypothetical protein
MNDELGSLKDCLEFDRKRNYVGYKLKQRIKELIEECTDRHFSKSEMFETFDKEKFAELVRADAIAKEREACLREAEVAISLLNDPVAAIRARGNT